MSVENKLKTSRTSGKTLESLDLSSGPNTAGLAQRAYSSREQRKLLYVLKNAYIATCTVNQY